MQLKASQTLIRPTSSLGMELTMLSHHDPRVLAGNNRNRRQRGGAGESIALFRRAAPRGGRKGRRGRGMRSREEQKEKKEDGMGDSEN